MPTTLSPHTPWAHTDHIQHHIQIVKKYLASNLAVTKDSVKAEQSIRWLETYFKIE